MTTTTDAYDAIVVGSGAGGGATAYALTKAGWKVLVLEKGPHLTERDFFHDELTLCRRNYFTPSPKTEPNLFSKNGQPFAPTNEGWLACCVGGGSVLMSGFFFRLHPEDFRVKTQFGNIPGTTVSDWPITYTDLEPFYDEAERVIGLSGINGQNPYEVRRTPYPLGPIASHPSGALVDGAAKELGFHPFQFSRAILSSTYQGRNGCSYCGYCGSYGCEMGAKSSSLVTFIAQAQKTRRLTLIPHATATRVLTGSQGRATGVEWIDSKGKTNKSTARVVVVACTSIQTTRLLLHSEIANSSGLLGKNLMLMTWASGYGRFPLPHSAFPESARGVPFIDRAIQDHYVLGNGKSEQQKGGTILFNLPHINPIHRAEKAAFAPDETPLWGTALKKKLREVFQETATIEFETFNDALPHENSDVTLDGAMKDPLGIPVAKIRMAPFPASVSTSDVLSSEARAVLSKMGAREQIQYPGDRAYPYLQAGTARMGKDPKSSVLDPFGQAHDVPNLFVADASGFPSSGGAPFTLTIMANALRVGAHIVERGKRHEL